MTAEFLTGIFASDFWTDDSVRTALAIGGGAACVSAVIGVFAIIRGQTFAGHALADISSAGGAAAFLAGVNPLFGFLAIALFASGAMEVADLRNVRERDLVTGIILGAGLGLTALLLYLDISLKSTTGAAISIMFGSMFAIPASILPVAFVIGAGALLVIAVIYRPLLLCSLDPELAAILGIRVRLIGLAFLFVLSLAVTLSAMTIGAILSTALLIGPAASSLRLAATPARAICLSVALSITATWAGIWLAYESYNWTPGHGWPVSFFIVAIIFFMYVASGLPKWLANFHAGKRLAATGIR